MTDQTDFDGCRRACRLAGVHTLISGECEQAPEPEPIVSLSRVFTDTDGHKSIGFDTYTVDQLAELLEPVLGSEAMRAREGSVDLAHLAAHTIIHRNDEPPVSSAGPAPATDREAVPTDEDFLVAIEEALESTLLPSPGVSVLERTLDAVTGALAPLVAQLRAAVLPAPTDQTAVTCSAQHHRFDDGRLCIRAAQHSGDHIDERGYHWSDTVAVYPLADGQFRTGANVRDALRRMAGETQQDEAPVTTADKAEALGMTPTKYRSESHRLGEQRIREASQWLRADVAFRVLDALDGVQQRPAREAQQDPTQDGTVLAAENEALWGELHRRDTETDQPHPVARPGQPETDCPGAGTAQQPKEA